MHHKRDKKGLHIPHSQHVDIPDLKHETVIIPSTSAPSWGSYFIFDCKEKGAIIHDLGIQFVASAISGLTGGTNPRYNPASFWHTRIEVVINNTVVDTIYPIQQFIHNQLFNDDPKRRLINNAMGPYDSASVRNTMSSASTSYYVDLWNLFQQTHIPLVYPKDDIQVRVYMDSIANVVVTGGATGTPSSTLQANLLVKLSRMSSGHVNTVHRNLSSMPHHHKFLETRFGTFSIPAPAAGSSATIVLTPFVGLVSYLFFVVRYSTTSGTTTVPNTGDGQFQYNAITNFSILDNTSTNIVGGQSIASAYALQFLNKDWIKSSYTAETAIGLTDTKANVYLYSFSADPAMSAETGVGYNAHRFLGNEQLQIQFGALGYSNVQVDVWAMCEAALEINHQYVKKISL
jgi:hypothetical protein